MLHCSFCTKSEHEVRKLVAGGGGGMICDECIAAAARIVADSDAADGPRGFWRRIAFAITRRLGRASHTDLRARAAAV